MCIRICRRCFLFEAFKSSMKIEKNVELCGENGKSRRISPAGVNQTSGVINFRSMRKLAEDLMFLELLHSFQTLHLKYKYIPWEENPFKTISLIISFIEGHRSTTPFISRQTFTRFNLLRHIYWYGLAYKSIWMFIIKTFMSILYLLYKTF